jgi:hypothetical protein
MTKRFEMELTEVLLRSVENLKGAVEDKRVSRGFASSLWRLATEYLGEDGGGNGNDELSFPRPTLTAELKKQAMRVTRYDATKNEVHFTVDVLGGQTKHGTALNAARVLVFAYLQHLGEPLAPRDKVIHSLRAYELYNSNFRTALANDRTIIHRGSDKSLLTLNEDGVDQACAYIDELSAEDHPGWKGSVSLDSKWVRFNHRPPIPAKLST